MKTLALLFGCGFSMVLGACGSTDDGVASQEGEVGGSEMLISVRDDSDFGNTIRMTGYIRLVEGNETKLSLRNDSRPGAPEIATHWIHGDRMAFVSFDESVRLGNPGDATIPAAGDCISVANPFFQRHGGRPTEFGAFAYSYVDGHGDAHPAWATNGSKVYRTAQECLADPQRAAIPATKPGLTKVWGASDFGNVIALRGAAEFKAGAASADLVLANVTNAGANVKGSIADVKIPTPPGAEKGGIFE